MKKGQKCTPEQRMNMRMAHLGKKLGPQSPETIRKRSIALTGIKYGPVSEEQKRIRSEKAKAKFNAGLRIGAQNRDVMAKPIEWIVDENGCHICTSHGLTAEGYPRTTYYMKGMRVAKYVWMQNNGWTFPKGHVIRHKCDNRLCINIDHLETGTTQENTRDRDMRERTARGSKHGMSKLDEEQVRAIKIELKQYSFKLLQELSKQYGMSVGNIRKIHSGRLWKHVVVE